MNRFRKFIRNRPQIVPFRIPVRDAKMDYKSCAFLLVGIAPYLFANISQCEEDDEPINTTTNRRVDTLGDLISNQQVTLQDLQKLLNSTITSQALESLKDSHQVANDFAKILVLDILNTKESRNNLGILLNSLFQYESVRCPTRELIYWSLGLPPTMRDIYALTAYQVAYWLAQEGALSTKQLLNYYALQWLRDDQVRAQVLCPLLTYVLQLEPVQDTLGDVIADALPYSKTVCEEAIVYNISELLKSPELKEFVKEGLIGLMKEPVAVSSGDNGADEVEEVAPVRGH